MSENLANSFEKIIRDLFELMGYSTEVDYSVQASAFKWHYIDLLVTKDGKTRPVEIKFYRSGSLSSTMLKSICDSFAETINNTGFHNGILITSANIPPNRKQQVLGHYDIDIWDRTNLNTLLTRYSFDLRDQFEQLLLAAQQGNQTEDVFSSYTVHEAEETNAIKINEEASVPINTEGKMLSDKLKSIPPGQAGWQLYEETCKDILHYLFKEDLVLWEKQPRTDDGLSRFDLVCRIASSDDYWKALISSFNTRFVLFEFKNYAEPINQHQVYSTERYLYTKALRSVGFIVAANGPSLQAIQAARGALKENGKLIMFLSNQDLCDMLKQKDNLESPNDYLSNKLDEWLISLSR